MNKDLVAIFEYMEREKGIKRQVVVDAIKESLQLAARKSISGAVNVSVHIDERTGGIEVYSEKEIVSEVEDPISQISLEAAQEIDPDAALSQFIDVEITPRDFGRIAAQTARQVIAQKLRSAERDVIYEEYRHRVNEIVSGTVKRFARGANLIVDLGKVDAILPARNYPKIERYQVGERVQALLLAVQDLDNGGAEVVLSRSSPEFVRQLFIQEVPELGDGTVTIDKIVREAGYRTKLVVRSSDMRVDPVGTCVGVRGTRVKAVVRELNNEKVDIIPYADDLIDLLLNILDPVEIRKVSVNDEEKVISIVVEDDDYATVIGRRGMNARLTGALLGHELEVQKISDYRALLAIERLELAESSIPELDEPLNLSGVSSLIVENLIEAGYNTPRKVLDTPPEDLATVPGIGISLETAEMILDEIKRAFAEKREQQAGGEEALEKSEQQESS